MGQDKTIKEQIALLIGLQVIDKEIYTLTAEKNNMPGELKSIEEALQSKKTRIKQAEERLKSLQVALKDKEVDLQQKEEQIKKLQTQLYQLKTNNHLTVGVHGPYALSAQFGYVLSKDLLLFAIYQLLRKRYYFNLLIFKIFYVNI